MPLIIGSYIRLLTRIRSTIHARIGDNDRLSTSAIRCRSSSITRRPNLYRRTTPYSDIFCVTSWEIVIDRISYPGSGNIDINTIIIKGVSSDIGSCRIISDIRRMCCVYNSISYDPKKWKIRAQQKKRKTSCKELSEKNGCFHKKYVLWISEKLANFRLYLAKCKQKYWIFVKKYF